MTKREFAWTSNVLYATACGITAMFYGIIFLLIEAAIFQWSFGDALSLTAQRNISLPREFYIVYGWVFVILLLIEWFLYEDIRDELRKIQEQLEEDPDFDLRFEEESILDGLDAISYVIRPSAKSGNHKKALIGRYWIPAYLQQHRWDIRQSALYRGVHIPAGDKYAVFFLLIPMLIAGVIFTSQGKGAAQRQETLVEDTRTYIEELAVRVEPYCETLEFDTLRGQDLTKSDENMYFGAEFGEENTSSHASIEFKFDKYCRVQLLNIQIGLDPSLTREEMLANTQKQLDLLYPMFADGNFATKDLYFEEMGVLPQKFCDSFLKADRYYGVNYTEIEDHPSVEFYYDLDEEQNLTEGSYIQLSLYQFG